MPTRQELLFEKHIARAKSAEVASPKGAREMLEAEAEEG